MVLYASMPMYEIFSLEERRHPSARRSWHLSPSGGITEPFAPQPGLPAGSSPEGLT
jgi:hypothetical protein